MNIRFPFLNLFLLPCLFAQCGAISAIANAGSDAVFLHGVASGDPLTDRVILWTRVTPAKAGAIDVDWEIAKDPSFRDIAASGTFTTHRARDYTVKVDAHPLEPGEPYYYRFHASGEFSDIGRTRTLPSRGVEHVNLAVVSCSHYEYGYFNTYAAIARDRLLDAVLHLGDYLYEYRAKAKRFGDSWDRKHEPDNELLTLSDYRTRYAQYRTDPDLQAAHRNHPFITVWDDHESANNSSSAGARNHDSSEGDWNARLQASRQAYLEWLPVREQDTSEIYRDFVFGDLVHLVMLDTRLAGRDEQVYDLSDERIYREDRSLLGKDQLLWLDERLGKTNTRWTVFGNQVIFSPLVSGMDPVNGRNGDSWDGYPAERLRVWDLIGKHGIHNWIIATGDTHQTFVFDLVPPSPVNACNSRSPSGSRGMEFGVPSITGANPGDRQEAGEVTLRELRLTRSGMNPHLKWVDMRNHGYLRVELSHDKAEGVYNFVEKIRERDSSSFEALRFEVPACDSGVHLYPQASSR